MCVRLQLGTMFIRACCTTGVGRSVKAGLLRHLRRDLAAMLEIVFPDGCRLRFGSAVSLPALRRVVMALRG